jgi:DNA (cytosine-5)-methyltransferase 1
MQGGSRQSIIVEKCVAMRGRNPDNPSDRTAGIPTEQRLEVNENDTINTLTSVQKDNLILKIRQATNNGTIDCDIPGIANLSFPDSTTRRGRVSDKGKTCPTLCASDSDICLIEEGNPNKYTYTYHDDDYIYYISVRKLTPRECWRFMGFEDEDFKKAQSVNSNTQLYKQAGNSIVKNVLMAIINNMNL